MNKTLAKFVLVFMTLGLISCSYNPIFSEKLGAKAIQGIAYLPGKSEN